MVEYTQIPRKCDKFLASNTDLLSGSFPNPLFFLHSCVLFLNLKTAKDEPELQDAFLWPDMGSGKWKSVRTMSSSVNPSNE